ncbi:endo-1,3-alpha-glucanase family glycosylhydrolase [Sedimentisphaera salicampi]|uniref:Glycosyl hydrolase family 71 n=1 Tax=Sedimentisphaera salicampi TaxID=1941349 RepID=A0A1W6LIU9_9BACT|nr:endo-1,3-alpha-glucanase family glycosylhydrolase [Sedimentisphaera salicampi]ARN55664.1 Glycosyl hydrolase family 71 [Sedimentisphaera salicampi]
MMKICNLAACLVFISAAFAVGAKEIKVGAYYYAWHGDNNFHGGADTVLRYHLSPKQTPVLGWYNQQNNEVISQHYKWAEYAGIDFFVVSFWGKGSDSILREKMFNNSNRGNTELAVFLEPSISSENISSQMDYLCQNYFNKEGYLHIDGKPAVFIYITRSKSTKQLARYIKNIRSRAAANGYEVYLAGDEVWAAPNRDYEKKRISMLDAVTNYDVYGNLGRRKYVQPSHLNHWQANNKKWKQLAENLGKDFIPAVSPGFNDTAVRKGHTPSSRKLQGEKGEFGSLFSALLERALKLEGSDMIMITSWNEWHEDTQIEPVSPAEPTKKDDGEGRYTKGLAYSGYGKLYLDILKEKTSPVLSD